VIVNLLPGPVAIHPRVRTAFARPPVSHRGADFVRLVQESRRRLAELAGAPRVEILLGSGTLANDVVAAQISLRRQPGLVLVNGEFGERLADHARRFGLACEELSAPWGQPLPYAALEERLAARPDLGWIWAVHCETSTGVLNDLGALAAIARRRGVALALDAISSLGTVPVDLTGVWLASGVSGKGLASYPGLGLVFHHHPVEPRAELPRYLDLGTYAAKESLPFTTSSNLLAALAASLDLLARDGWGRLRFARLAELGGWLRRRLETQGWRLLAPCAIASPAVHSLLPEDGLSALALGEALERQGYLLSYRSEYLVRRNIIQICLMGQHRREELEALLARLAELRGGMSLRQATAAAGVEPGHVAPTLSPLQPAWWRSRAQAREPRSFRDFPFVARFQERFPNVLERLKSKLGS
jgi:aspartate aminotransferase-like enzyme